MKKITGAICVVLAACSAPAFADVCINNSTGIAANDLTLAVQDQTKAVTLVSSWGSAMLELTSNGQVQISAYTFMTDTAPVSSPGCLYLIGVNVGGVTTGSFGQIDYNNSYWTDHGGSQDHNIGSHLTALDILPAPEPATWAMLISGLGLVGISLRHRRPTRAAFA